MHGVSPEVLKVISYPFEKGFIPLGSDHHTLFLNAAQFPTYHDLSWGTFEAVQPFKPAYWSLRELGADVQPDVTKISHRADATMIALPKNQIEAQGLIATALLQTKPDGHVCIAGGNKAGGNRIVKTLKSFGIEDVQQETMNRCRIVWFSPGRFDEGVANDFLSKAAAQDILDGEYRSQPGIYGWDKLDKGSALLIESIDIPQFRVGADFGCGYGYLSREIFKHVRPDIWICADADWRALQACEQNLHAFQNDMQLRYDWLDLTQKIDLKESLDFIVMNPPFHEGQKGKPEIGNAFIQCAADALKDGGQLWMVANNHLPYEQVLNSAFSSIEKIIEKQGFKVYRGVK